VRRRARRPSRDLSRRSAGEPPTPVPTQPTVVRGSIFCDPLQLNPELSMGPFRVTQPNPTHQLRDPTQPNPPKTEKSRPNPTRPNPTQPMDNSDSTHQLTDPTQPDLLQVETFGPNPIQPNTTNNGAYSLVDRSAVESNLTAWCSQILSNRALKAST